MGNGESVMGNGESSAALLVSKSAGSGSRVGGMGNGESSAALLVSKSAGSSSRVGVMGNRNNYHYERAQLPIPYYQLPITNYQFTN
ncbi:hypothetical protein [Tolypothrix sp. NIES-4075]|uniref:hypothetical protein n=1 Tax=Tolypothrix sp. NIES-4075 TaxID=2005459 RepID=UPI00190EFB2D|nr:hypothetical protein [Tolypothrix sp. NIES-4075]